MIAAFFAPYIRTLSALGAGAVALVLALLYAGHRGASRERAREAARRAKADAKANERIDNAPTLRNSSDTERITWLRKYAKRNGN